jgi:hypothetical protein
MIYAKDTPNHVGITLYGDNLDFRNLYEAVEELLGVGDPAQENEVHTRILALNYDLRHAMQGDRETEWVDAGRRTSLLGEVFGGDAGDGEASGGKKPRTLRPALNAYYKFNILWPEALYEVIALNGVIRQHASKRKLVMYSDMEPKVCAWDPVYSQIRIFQSAVLKALREIQEPALHARQLKAIAEHYGYYNDYCTQFVDELNVTHLQLPPEKCVAHVATVVRRLTSRSSAYDRVERAVMEVVRRHGVHPSEVRGVERYPDGYEIEW